MITIYNVQIPALLLTKTIFKKRINIYSFIRASQAQKKIKYMIRYDNLDFNIFYYMNFEIIYVICEQECKSL